MFEFLLVIGLLLAYYGYSVSNNSKMWGEQGKKEIKEENWKEYVKRNGHFFMYSGILLALLAAVDEMVSLSNLVYIVVLVGGELCLYYPFGKWMKEKEGTWYAWPNRHKKEEKKQKKQQEKKK